MPSSNLLVAPTVLHLIWQVRLPDRPLRILDIGPGWGKYATLTREYVEPGAELSAVEAWGPYIAEHRLDQLYDQVVEADILDAFHPGPVADLVDWADVVLLIDVIEHIPKPDALALLDRIPGTVIISTPRDFFDNGPDLPPTEEHVSHWTADEFAAMARCDYVDADMLDRLGGIICRLRSR